MVGAALIMDMSGSPPLDGPWVGELFRHPEAPPAPGPRMLVARSTARAPTASPRSACA